MRIDRLVKVAVAALDEIKARDVMVFNVVKLTSMFDRVILATGDSTRQLKALADNVHDKVKAAGGKVYGREGEEDSEWILLDLGAAVVHIMHPTARAYYKLEEIWGTRPARARKRAKATAEE